MKFQIIAFSMAAFSIAGYATTITYTSSGTSTGGNTVNASATFTTSAGELNITLDNLLQNQTDVGQNISDLIFTLDVGGTATLSSSSGTEVTVNSGGTYTVGSSVSTGWLLTSLGGDTFELNVLGTTAGPSHTILGTSSTGNYTSGSFSSANGSIAGNGPHNPFLESGATFTIMDSSITSATNVTASTVSFGTTAGNDLAGTVTCTGSGCGGGVQAVPEPFSWGLVGMGLIAVGAIRRRRQA